MIEEPAVMDGGDEVREDEEGEEDDVDTRRDPFLQPPILKVFFELLPPDQLAKCRLVNKLWYKESLSTWRSNATVKIKNKVKLFETDRGVGWSTASLRDFLDHWDTGGWDSCPFKKFHLGSWIFGQPYEDEEWEALDEDGWIEFKSARERFMELVGGHITSLTLEWCSFFGRDHFRRIVFQAFPNLQFFKMLYCRVNSDFFMEQPTPQLSEEEILAYKEPAFGVHGLQSLNISRGRPHSIMDLLCHFHKIKSLYLRIEGGHDDYFYEKNLLDAIRLIREPDQSKLPLKNLDVEFTVKLGQRTGRPFHPDLLELYDQLKLPPLPFLEIQFDPEPEKDLDGNFNNGELEALGSDRHWLCTPLPVRFDLENLKKLRLLTPRFSGNLNYLRNTPNLQVLEIADGSLTLSESDNLFSSSQFGIGDWPQGVTELGLDLPLSLCSLGKLMKWVPNLERLWFVELDDVKFSMVCENWKNLKHLEDWGCELTDEGVTGTSGGDGEAQSAPNITKLKNLTSFETCSSKLTSVSVHDGFLKLANLKELSLGQSTKLDDEAKAALEKRKIKWDTSNNYIS